MGCYAICHRSARAVASQRKIIAAKKAGGRRPEFPGELQRCAEHYMAVHCACYGTLFLKPKSHWMFDVVHQIQRDAGAVYDNFVVERLHLRVKKVATHSLNTMRFEKTVMSGLLQTVLSSLDDATCCEPVALLGERFAVSELPGVELAPSLRHHGAVFKAGDMVISGTGLGCVLACALDDGIFYVVCEKYVFKEASSRHSCTFQRSVGQLTIFEAATLLDGAWC